MSVSKSIRISPSIASSDTAFIAQEIKRIGSNFDTLHVDIEDGNFVDNISFGMKTVRRINELSPKPLSVHLMTEDPEKYIHKLKDFNCEYIFVHIEKQQYVLNLVNLIKSYGFKAGIALNPISQTNQIRYILDSIDAILFMTSEPDNVGELFNEKILEKIQEFKEISNTEIWIDGGVKREYLAQIRESNIDVCVVGREVFQSSNPKQYIDEFQKANEERYDWKKIGLF